jgi:hypothetical protein
LNARSTAQQLVVNSGLCEAFVELSRAEGSPPQAINRSTLLIEQLLIYDGGEAFWTSDLAAGSLKQAAALSPSEANERYRRLLFAHRPLTPPGFTAPTESNSYRSYNNFDTGFSPPDFGSSLLEQALNGPAYASPSSGRVYIAVLSETPPFVPVAVAGCRQEAGFHVIQGQW